MHVGTDERNGGSSATIQCAVPTASSPAAAAARSNLDQGGRSSAAQPAVAVVSSQTQSPSLPAAARKAAASNSVCPSRSCGWKKKANGTTNATAQRSTAVIPVSNGCAPAIGAAAYAASATGGMTGDNTLK